jgi:polyhydroxyalkanoate synthesis regulator protein
MSQESPRLDRIENIVTVLEVDIKTMSKAVTELAGSVKQLVALQTDQQLLKQEMEHRCEIVHSRLRNIEKDMQDFSQIVHTKASKEEEETLKKQLKEIEPLVMLVRYPKAALIGILFFYLLAFQEVRQLVLPFL